MFPSGKAFGYIAYPPRGADDVPYNEGFLFDGDGALIPARVVSAPWLREPSRATRTCPSCSETADGRRAAIKGTT